MDSFDQLEWLLLSADSDQDDSAIAPPIHQTVHFAAGSAEEFDQMNSAARPDRSYRRYGNPTLARLQQLMAAVEGAEAGLATASGMGALSTLLVALASSGDHVVAQESMYGGTLSWLREIAPRLGIDVTLVDQTDPAAFERAVTPRTTLFLLETPSNPLLRLTDLAAVSDLARGRGIRTVVDNTVATPVNTRPIEHGVDLVVHSVTKALSGHSDAQAGLILGATELVDRIWQTHTLMGSVLSPFDAWLALRGLRTLTLRVARQNETALALAQFLSGHPAVELVHYPGLPSHPQHDLAKRQMRGFGGLLSFELRGGYDSAARLIAGLQIAHHSQSLGSIRSLAVQPAAMWVREMSEEQPAAVVPPGLIRFSVGLEPAADLIADLERALED